MTTSCFENDLSNCNKFRLKCVVQIVNSLQEKQSSEDECVTLASVQSSDRKKEHLE